MGGRPVVGDLPADDGREARFTAAAFSGTDGAFDETAQPVPGMEDHLGCRRPVPVGSRRESPQLEKVPGIPTLQGNKIGSGGEANP